MSTGRKRDVFPGNVSMLKEGCMCLGQFSLHAWSKRLDDSRANHEDESVARCVHLLARCVGGRARVCRHLCLDSAITSLNFLSCRLTSVTAGPHE